MATEGGDDKFIKYIAAGVLIAVVLPVFATVTIIKSQCHDNWFSRLVGSSKTCDSTVTDSLSRGQVTFTDAAGKKTELNLSALESFVQEQKVQNTTDPNFDFSIDGNALTISSGSEKKTVDLTEFVKSLGGSTDNQTLKLNGKVLSIVGGNSIDLSKFLGLADYSAGAGIAISGTRFISATANGDTSLTIGDIKSGIQTADHNGWVKLDGRALTSLTSHQQANAATLNLVGNLPNADNSILAQNGTTLGSISGANSRTLAQNQLPNVTLNGTTDPAGAHSHSYQYPTTTSGAFSVIFGPNIASDSSFTQTTSTAPDHTHTFTTSSLNGNVTQQAIDITPRSLSVNQFIYLGL